jgi:acyl-CoA thioester hydrolase
VRIGLTPSLDPTDYPFVHRIRTRFAETDAMGIIHHGAYAPYLEEARTSLLRQRGHPYESVRQQGIDLPVLELFVQYRRPLRFEEQVTIHVDAGHFTRATFQIGYLLTVEGEARATAVTVHGAIDSTGKAVRMPSWLVGALEPDGAAPYNPPGNPKG